MDDKNQELVSTSFYELKTKAYSCEMERRFKEVEIISSKTKVYDRAIALHDILSAVLWENTARIDDSEEAYTPDGIYKPTIDELTAQAFGYEPEPAFDGGTEEFNAEQKSLKDTVTKAAFHYKRYCRAEKRKIRTNIIDKLPAIPIQIGPYVCNIKPQALFIQTPIGFIKEIEAVWYADKKSPAGIKDGFTILDYVTDWDAKNPNGEKTNEERLKYAPAYLRQYVMLKYVQKLLEDPQFCAAEGLTGGELICAKGSMYFMEMKSRDEMISTYFEDGMSNISTLSENYKVGSPNEAPTELDDVFRDYAVMHFEGTVPEKCNPEKDCVVCPLKASCRFQKAPVHIVSEETGKKKKKSSDRFVPTEGQKAMLSARNGNYLVIARAGSGKTATLVERYAELVSEGVKPSEILMTTFTKNSVEEFKIRIADKLKARGIEISEADAEAMNKFITTFHAFALTIVKEFFEEVGYTAPPKEVNDVDKAKIIDTRLQTRQIVGGKELYGKTFDGVLKIVKIAIRLFDAIGEHPVTDDIGDEAAYYRTFLKDDEANIAPVTAVRELMDVYKDYCKELKDRNIILFSDMEPMMLEIANKHSDLFERYGFKAVLLDEWQDSNDIQMETVKRIKTPLRIAVGDDGQSIYGFRNSNVDNIINFEAKLGEPTTKISMLENWRSVPEILETADNFLDLNENKTEGHAVAGRKASGIKPEIVPFYGEDEERSWIVERMKKYHDEEGLEWEQLAYIARTNSEISHMAGALANAGIPYVMKNPMKFSDNSRVKAALGFIDNAYYNPESTEGFFAYLAAKYDGEMLNEKTAEEVQEEIQKLRDTYANIDDVDELVQQKMLHQYLDALRKDDEVYISFLDEYLYQYGNIEDELQFIEDFKKYGSKLAKRISGNYKGVVLITMHSSKGLEWDVCFVSLTKCDSPMLHMQKYAAQVEEERRLIYVAMTRARNNLHVSSLYFVPGTKSRKKEDGGIVYNQFLKELCMQNDVAYDPVDHEEEARKAAARKAAYAKKKAKASEKKSD